MMKIASALNGTKRLMFGRSLPLLMIIVLLGGTLSLGGCEDEQAEVVFPEIPPEEARKWLFDVYGTSANDVYVGGNLGIMWHFDGTDWTQQVMGTTAAITTIWGLPDDNTLYAVGHGGKIWRNTGSGWSGMDSGTTQNLYGVGSFDDVIHAVGQDGVIRRLSGGSWNGTGSVMMILDENDAATDTLSIGDDLASMLAINHYFIGGAYHDPRFEGERFGTAGTKGNILATNVDAALDTDWILRPLGGEQVVDDEWVLCMSSDPDTIAFNMLGTSEGWLFKLRKEGTGDLVWKKFVPEFTDNPGAGIRDLWVAGNGDVYVVTDEGRVIYQSFDYSFTDATGSREILFDGSSSLVAIWATDPSNIYFTGYFDEVLFHGSHDAGAGTFDWTPISLVPDPNKSVGNGSLVPGLNEIGRPLHY